MILIFMCKLWHCSVDLQIERYFISKLSLTKSFLRLALDKRAFYLYIYFWLNFPFEHENRPWIFLKIEIYIRINFLLFFFSLQVKQSREIGNITNKSNTCKQSWCGCWLCYWNRVRMQPFFHLIRSFLQMFYNFSEYFFSKILMD